MEAFVRETFVREAVAQFLRLAEPAGIALVAYTFMPDHVHFLLESPGDADIREVVRRWKLTVGFAWKRQDRRRNHLWQRGYYDRVLRADEDLAAVARYVVMNPVRAGLVMSPENYPFSGSSVATLRELAEYVQAWEPPRFRPV